MACKSLWCVWHLQIVCDGCIASQCCVSLHWYYVGYSSPTHFTVVQLHCQKWLKHCLGVYTCLHTHAYTHILTHTQTNTHACMHAHTYTHACTHMHNTILTDNLFTLNSSGIRYGDDCNFSTFILKRPTCFLWSISWVGLSLECSLSDISSFSISPSLLVSSIIDDAGLEGGGYKKETLVNNICGTFQ